MLKQTTTLLKSSAQRLHLSFSGVFCGLLLYGLSFTPSLLPRGYVLQGVLSGLSFTTGYGLGVFLAFLLHKLPLKFRLALSPVTKRIVLIFMFVLAIGFMAGGYHWQQEIRRFTEAEPVSGAYPIQIILVTAVLAFLLIWGARGARHVGRFLGAKLARHTNPSVARYSGGILAAILLIFLINGVLLKSIFGVINYTFGLANGNTPADIYQPQNSLFSGSPASEIDWNTLGEKGREFVGSAPSESDIAKFSRATSPQELSRLYVGLESAPTLQERVDLLVEELERTDAGKQKAILIAIPTGSGGVNAKSIESVEYLYGGATTSLAIQYSYLPSWLSFVADQETARENGRVLTEAVYTWWNHLPAENRPKLLMYGESLGTLGADGAFSGVSDMQNRMDGVLLAGPPHANQLWQGIVSSRETGSREVLPIYQHGEAVRFTDGVTPYSKNPDNFPWGSNRVGIIQHGSDPVVWASTSLFLHKPDWLSEPRGSDVSPNMRWYPFVTGWQVGLDLPFAFGATPGHGHRYSNSLLSSWIDILDMHLSPDETAELQRIIDGVEG